MNIYKLEQPFITEAGEEIPDAFLAYKTYGDPTNEAIVYPTWFSGAIEDNEWLISTSHKSLNPERYFIIVPAMFGNSQSSSPSNHPLGEKLPHTSYYDNVRAQHELVTKHLKIRRLFAVIGWSMAAGQTYQWATAYPSMVDRIVPFCGAARTALHNITFLRSLVLTLHNRNQSGDGSELDRANKEVFAAIYSSWGLSQAFYRQELFKQLGFDSLQTFLDGFWTPMFAKKDARDLLHMLRTWIAGDISSTPGMPFTHSGSGRSPDASYIAALRSIKARALVIPCRTDLYFPSEDSEFEVTHLVHGRLWVHESVWGHSAGAPALNPADAVALDIRIGEFFDEDREMNFTVLALS